MTRGYGGNGGAVYSTGGLTIANSRIHSNRASSLGGGIGTLADWEQPVDLVNCTMGLWDFAG